MSLLLTGCTTGDRSAFIENTSQDVVLLYNPASEGPDTDAVRIDTSANGDNSQSVDISLAANPKDYANSLHFSDELTPGSFDESDYRVLINSVDVGLGDDFLQCYEKIGTPKIEKSKACLEQGYDIDYYYDDDKLVFFTMVKDSKQLIFNIEIRSDRYFTTKGARIGRSTKDNIYELYGMPTDYSGTMFKYVLKDKQYSLEFIFDADGVLEGIDYIDNSVM